MAGFIAVGAYVVNGNLSEVIITIIYVIALVMAGYEVLKIAVLNIIKMRFLDENSLMTFAAIAAFALGEAPEAVAIMIFYGAGETVQGYATAKSRGNIAELMDIRPDYAVLKETGEKVDPKDVEIGEVIIIRPGEKIPLDGKVVFGKSFVDTKALTGESVPREAYVGSEVLSGSINKNGLIEVEVEKTFGESTVSKILELVEKAQSKKSESEKFITKFAKYYTPIVVGVAALVAILPPIIGFGTFDEWLYKGLSFLIISCPCALVISIPISFFGGIGGAARQGVLVKGGNYLEALNLVDTVVFDKTGTLTKGSFSVTNIVPIESNSEEAKNELLYFAATAEQFSSHPIAKSITAKWNNRETLPNPEISEIAGKGVVAEFNGQIAYVGNSKLLNEIGIETLSFAKTAVHVAVNGEYKGYILIEDEIKAEAKQAILDIKTLGIKDVIMLTGDSKPIAYVVAEEIGITRVEAELLPGDKVDKLEKIMEEKKNNKFKTIFVGDGINDAPVLTRSDIGIAMGGIGSDAAIEAADVVLMTDEVSKVATAIKVAKKTRTIVTENIIFALGTKLIIMVLALLGITSIWMAIFADVGVALIATANATRAMISVDAKKNNINDKETTHIND